MWNKCYLAFYWRAIALTVKKRGRVWHLCGCLVSSRFQMWACLPFIYLLNSFLPSSYFWKVNILAVWGKFKILLQLCFFQWGNTIHSFPPADDWVNKIAHHHDIFWHDTQLIAIDNDMNELEPPEKLNYDRMRGNWRDYSGTSVGTNQNNNWTITRQKAIYWSELWHGKTLGGDSSTEHWITRFLFHFVDKMFFSF